mgnify:CR=1 FL=1|tara:strand:- start:159 stop:506 length:348 start_codon:yes stop_codon:yes gene_type:complete
MFGLKKLFGNIQRLGSKRNMANLARIGKKLSHEATRQLTNVAKVAGEVSAKSGGVVPLKLFADAVGGGARTAITGIEIGKDIGAKDFRKAKSRVPELSREATQTAANLEAAAMFV